MGPHFLDYLFNAKSIALFGASERPDSLGTKVFRNLLRAGFKGKLFPINPKHKEVQGHPCVARLDQLGQSVDLALVVTPAVYVNDIIRQCGERGVKVALVLSAGFCETGPEGRRLERELKDTAAHYGIRLVGPNCLGFIRPGSGIDATFLDSEIRPGKLALVSQSAALCTSILDWAAPHEVGFSAVISLGNGVDVDFGDFFDFLALDPQTQAILIYVECVRKARRFISGLRAASRMKPVIVLKVGRNAEGSRAAMTHTGAMIGSDEVFGVALERAGVVRALTVGQLFAAAELLGSGARVSGNRLCIVTNGGGPGALAADRATELGVTAAELSEKVLEKLDPYLPPYWSHGNPIDILGDATPERFAEVTKLCLKESNTDGVLVLLAPQPATKPTETAKQLLEVVKNHPEKPVLACWMGQTSVNDARQIFAKHRIPSFSTPERAVEAFSYLCHYYQNQQLLLQTPGPLTDARPPDIEGARLIIESVLAEGRTVLTELESKAVLSAFHIKIVQTYEVHSASEALVAAQSMGFPVALKISSPDITHKSDAGGVTLNVTSAQEVRSAYKLLLDRVQTALPEARIRGVTVQPMAVSANMRELMVGVARDPVFGPVISFGSGGTAVEVLKDRAFALPPLNGLLARSLIDRTRVAKLLEPFRRMAAVNREELEMVLLRVSELVCELPHIAELDINPLLADDKEAIVVDARIVVERPAPTAIPYAHMAIHPYPHYLESNLQLSDGTNVTIRPARPEDAEMEREFVRNLSPESKYFRFMQSIKELTPDMLVRFTQLDYDREMSLVAIANTSKNKREEVGVARYTINPDGRSCEFALVVNDKWHKHGIGSRLMEQLFEVARSRGLHLMEGEVLTDNHRMLSLVRELGFTIRPVPDDPGIRQVERRL